jgi:Protein of unknown function (DUF3147)
MTGVRDRRSDVRDRRGDVSVQKSNGRDKPSNGGEQEPKLTWFQAPPDSPSIDLEKSSHVSVRHLLLRFAFGAATSAVAGVISIVWNARTAGIMLAFPAILAASLTLIADEESRRSAREDARGAVLGAVGLGAFAVVGYFAFGHLGSVLVLALALLAWVCVAGGLYLVLWSPSRGLLRGR